MIIVLICILELLIYLSKNKMEGFISYKKCQGAHMPRVITDIFKDREFNET